MKSESVRLEIQNVTQDIGLEDVSFAKKLSEKTIKHSQRKLPNGNIEITIELDPSIKAVKNE